MGKTPLADPAFAAQAPGPPFEPNGRPVQSSRRHRDDVELREVLAKEGDRMLPQRRRGMTVRAEPTPSRSKESLTIGVYALISSCIESICSYYLER